jgi:flavodoxin
MKILVAFYSRTGKTKLVAKTVSWEINGKLMELQEVKGRSEGTRMYACAGFQAITNKGSKLKPFDTNVAEYEFIFIGSPIWAGRVPPAINTFISSVDLKNKRVVAFFTMDGDDSRSAVKDITKKVVKKSGEFVGSFAIRGRDATNKEIIDKTKEMLSTIMAEIH